MSDESLFEIKKCNFKGDVVAAFQDIHYLKALWPVIYLLTNKTTKEMYVGETADLYTRMSAHLKDLSKSKLKRLDVITSGRFNKSATLDIESNLIKYIAGDGLYQLLNANVGVANHDYFQKKEIYWDIFTSIWDKLRTEGLAKHAIRHIDNSDLFKYSPYKSLNADQKLSLLAMMKNLLNDNIKTTVIEGGAGTGKTVLAIFLFKLLNTDISDINLKDFGDQEEEFIRTVYMLKERYRTGKELKMALVVPVSSFRSTLQKVFRKINGLSADMVVSPSQITNDRFDIIVVDEAHRLRRRVSLGSYFRDFDKISTKLGFDQFRNTELDWILKQGQKCIIFFDENQSVRPSDVEATDFITLKLKEGTYLQKLKSQLRLKGGVDYVEYVHKLMTCSFQKNDKLFRSKRYSFVMFDSLEEMIEEIKVRDRENGLSRIIAGFSWPWISKRKKGFLDIKIGNVEMQWNSVSRDWINSPNAINEAGCIHTSQGYDLNFAGIILGNEISYDEEKNEIIVIKKNYFDKAGKTSITDHNQLKRFIINIYTTILQRGISGTYVYACDEKLRKYLSKYIPKAGSSRTVKVADDDMEPAIIPYENAIPLYDLRAAAGTFSEQQVTDIGWVPLPSGIKPSKTLFACQVVGESMNKVIPNGSICLFKKDEGGSREGKIVLAQYFDKQDSDTGSAFTIKEYRSKKYIGQEEWYHESIVLSPLSNDTSYQPIVLEGDEKDSFTVIGIFERVLSTDSLR